MTKQILVIGTASMTTLLALVVIWQFRIVLIYVLISLALAATIRPLVRSKSRQNFLTRLLIILFYVASLGIVGLLIFLVGRLLIGDLQQLTQKISEQSTWLLPPALEGSLFQQALDRWLPTPDRLFDAITGRRQFIVSAVFGFTRGLGGMVSAFFVLLLLSIYWSINQNHFERLWLSLLPSEQRTPAREIWRTLEHDLGAYIRSEIVQSLLVVLLLGFGYWLFGAPYPALLAVVGALAWLIPMVGAILALLLPLLLGLLTSAPISLFAVLYTLLVLIALQVWVESRLFRRKLDNPILTMVMLLALADAFGIFGVIIAPPLSVVIQTLWRLLVSDRLASDTAVQFSDLKERQLHLYLEVELMEGPPPPLVISSMERLALLLKKAESILESKTLELVPSSNSIAGENVSLSSINPE